MTASEKRNFLRRYGEFVYIAKNYGKQIKELRLAVLPSGIRYDIDRVESSLHGDRLAEYMARLDELATKYDNALGAVFEAHRAIDKLKEPKHRIILNMYYIEQKKIWEIAKQLNYSSDWIKELKKTAIDILEIDEDVFENAKHI